MGTILEGTFDIKRTPEPPYDVQDGVTLGRTAFDKRFHGGLEATSHVEMLAALTPIQGSAGYVALERVRGSVQGRTGTFVLQHSGTMGRGKQELSVTVVPDSGTGELAGLTGRMTIDIVEGKHLYTFEVSFT